MIDQNVGVSPLATYEIKKIDTDNFLGRLGQSETYEKRMIKGDRTLGSDNYRFRRDEVGKGRKGRNTMIRFVALSCLLILVLGVGALGCAGLSFQRIDLKDLPETPFEATVYRSGTKGLAVILDEPNDGVVATVTNEKFRAKKDGLKVPQGYLRDFIWTPYAYLLQDKEGEKLGYLLISRELEWVVQYNRGREVLDFWIEDRYDVGGGAGE